MEAHPDRTHADEPATSSTGSAAAAVEATSGGGQQQQQQPPPPPSPQQEWRVLGGGNDVINFSNASKEFSVSWSREVDDVQQALAGDAGESPTFLRPSPSSLAQLTFCFQTSTRST